MDIKIREYICSDVHEAAEIWNSVVEDGTAFPQENTLDEISANDFFIAQTYTGIAVDCADGGIVGLYILHPNNVGRCSHISNASYAVKPTFRNKGIGEKLVLHCIGKGRELGFKILQFNAVVISNKSALHLYEKLGFTRLGIIPGGFKSRDGSYEDIVPHFIKL